jgi:hypothetical protein
LATDLSPQGLFLCSPLALLEGDQVTVTFTPPRWPEALPPVHATARVVRAAVPRRKTDRSVPSGMGLCFERMHASEVEQLVMALRGLPPPLPMRALSTVAGEPMACSESETSIVFDGFELELCAEAPLMTAGSPVLMPRSAWVVVEGVAPSAESHVTASGIGRRRRACRRRSHATLVPRRRAPGTHPGS